MTRYSNQAKTARSQTAKVSRIKNKSIVLFNKPFNVLCQFTDESNRKTLKDYVPIPNIYAAGRLDRDSEGLLVLTNDGKLQATLTQPKCKIKKTYFVQVEGAINRLAIDQLCQGVTLKDGPTLPAKAALIDEPDWLWPRTPPIRKRQQIPTSWFYIQLIEGRNRQIRRMTARVGFPTLRLIRYSIGSWSIEGLNNGEYKQLT